MSEGGLAVAEPERDRLAPGDSGSVYSPTWGEFMRDMHSMDKRITLLEAALLTQGKTMERIEDEAKETRAVLHRIEKQLDGWRGSIAVIVASSGGIAAGIVFVVDKLWS